MLAEVARLRGAARAAVRALQEQDKTIVTAEDANKKLRKKVKHNKLHIYVVNADLLRIFDVSLMKPR
jgi:hypothetical protein